MFLEIKSKHHLVFAHHLFMAIIVFLLSSRRDESPLFGEICHGTNISATSDNEQVNAFSFFTSYVPIRLSETGKRLVKSHLSILIKLNNHPGYKATVTVITLLYIETSLFFDLLSFNSQIVTSSLQ